MTDVRTLVRHSTQYMGGRLGLMLLGFISFPLFTRIFSVAEYGLINLVLKIVLFATALSKMGFQHSVVRFYEKSLGFEGPRASRTYYSTFFLGTLATAGAVATLFWLGTVAAARWWLPPKTQELLAMAAWLVFTGAVRSILSGFLRAAEKTNFFNLLEVLTKLLCLFAIAALVFTWQPTAKAFLAGSIFAETSGILAISGTLLRRRMISTSAFSSSMFRQILLFGFPLIGFELANLALDSGDRLLVGYYLGSEPLGYYSAAYNIAGYVTDLLSMPLTLALLPIYVKVWATKGPAATGVFLSRGLDWFLCLAVGVLSCTAVTSKSAVTLLASKKFVQAHALVPWLVLGLLICTAVLFLNAGLYLHNKTVTIAKITILLAAVNVILNAIFLRPFGIAGAAAATVLSYAFLAIVTARRSFELLPLDVDYRAMLKYVLAGVISFLATFWIQTSLLLLDVALAGFASLLIYAVSLYIIHDPFRAQARNWMRFASRNRGLATSVGDYEEEIGVEAKWVQSPSSRSGTSGDPVLAQRSDGDL